MALYLRLMLNALQSSTAYRFHTFVTTVNRILLVLGANCVMDGVVQKFPDYGRGLGHFPSPNDYLLHCKRNHNNIGKKRQYISCVLQGHYG